MSNLLLFLLTFVFCISAFGQEMQYDSLAIDSASITLERGPCFGICPEYEVTVHGNGQVEFQGSNGLESAESHSAQIHASEARDLIEFTVSKVRFDTLQEKYFGNIDDPERITTLRIGGKTKSVSNIGDGPKILTELELMIDEVAATSRWLKRE